MKPILQVNLTKLPSGDPDPWLDFYSESFTILQTIDVDEPAFKLIGTPDPGRREELVARFAAAIVSNPNVMGGEHGYDFVADRACKYADALIKELDK